MVTTSVPLAGARPRDAHPTGFSGTLLRALGGGSMRHARVPLSCSIGHGAFQWCRPLILARPVPRCSCCFEAPHPCGVRPSNPTEPDTRHISATHPHSRLRSAVSRQPICEETLCRSVYPSSSLVEVSSATLSLTLSGEGSEASCTCSASAIRFVIPRTVLNEFTC